MKNPRGPFLLLIFLLYCTVSGTFSQVEVDSITENPDKNRDFDFKFEGDDYWEDEQRDLCDDEKLTDNWTWDESVCVIYIRHFRIVKMEILSWSPALVIYRDMFTENQVDHFLEYLHYQQLEEQQVVNDDGTDFYSPIRKANGTNIDPRGHPAPYALFQTASNLIPTINFDAAEDIVALSYKPGGHYAVHLDYLEYPNKTAYDWWMKEYGNRLATFITILKKADKGGATIFPLLGTVVRANVGDAFLWFNSMANLEQENLSEHGGCPVYSGTKVISTIWVRQRDQPIFDRLEGGYSESIPADALIPGETDFKMYY